MGIRNVCPTPIRSGMSCGARAKAVSNGLNYRPLAAKISNDSLKGGNRFLLWCFALRNIPVAALGLKKYLSWTGCVSITADNVDSLARLGDS